ncbi:protein kintoun [Etheostoma spectabile]|uniref:protein kintoun n=1 Tax=Etheostoma spectabile TaxID=54343 RepID=UPI0013AFA91A|nr:protein kintoun [Etheostoma spectabile]
MEAGGKLKELNTTEDEVDRLTQAFKDEKFREMFRDYVNEISDPENKKKYEEEIKHLEQERGNTIEFIHPEPFRALRTSVNGQQECFINICANEKVGKPECKWRVSEDGRRGQSWSLPHSLHPGRPNISPKGNKAMIYDVIFHPDTLHIASKNKRFMDVVDSTAIQGIQTAFKVTLDQNNVREINKKYKGLPQPCVIRKPIPGYKAKEPSEEPDPLAFPYPDEKGPTTSQETKPTESPATKNSSDAEPKSSQIQPQKAKEPTKPNYTVRYRSFIDLQDFRCSRDSAQSPRPKEIVFTIDMPLLKAATDASLEVKERLLLLESKKPAYRLELPLAYPVDEDKGEAKFNKQRGQLTVTLPVLPSNEAFDFALGSAHSSVSDDERQEEKSEVEEDDNWKEKEKESLKTEEEQRGVEKDLRQQTRLEKGEEEGEKGQDGGEEQMREEHGGAEGSGVEEEKLKEQEQGNESEVGNLNLQKTPQHKHKNDFSLTSLLCDIVDVSAEKSLPVDNRLVASPETENQPVLITAEYSSCIGKGEENLNSCLESTLKMKTSDMKEEAAKTRESVHGNEVETDAAFLHLRTTEESQSSVAANTSSRNSMKDCCPSQESSKMPATDEANDSSRGSSGNRATFFSEDRAKGSVKREERESVDDLLTGQIFHNPGHGNKPPPVLLREIDEDGNEKIISDHSTSAGFIFQNTLMYELD